MNPFSFNFIPFLEEAEVNFATGLLLFHLSAHRHCRVSDHGIFMAWGKTLKLVGPIPENTAWDLEPFGGWILCLACLTYAIVTPRARWEHKPVAGRGAD